MLFRVLAFRVLFAGAMALPLAVSANAQTIPVTIGHQSMCTDTYTAGIVVKELKLLEKHLPKTGKYQNAKFEVSWSDYASGGPITNLQRIDWSGLARSWLVRLLSLALGVAIWHVLSETKFKFFINFENVPGPLTVLAAAMGHLKNSTFYVHIGVSIQRILISFGLATALGIFLGVIMGRSRVARDMVTPYIEILRPIPAVAWIPLAILMWPTEESSIIYITFLGALFPIVLNTVHGVEQTPEVLVRAAQSLGASSLEIFWHVVMPAALPCRCFPGRR
jgi:ABC-type nitrate/sulfonate/bicarbonate transport system permease component